MNIDSSKPLRNKTILCFSFVFALVLSSASFGQDGNRWSYPKLEQVSSIRDGRTGKVIGWDDFRSKISEADVVFLGEAHDDDATHEFQLAVYNDLLKQRNGNVVLAMEMFERDTQATLDRYLAGEIDEATFLRDARPWGNYGEAYRPLVERAKELRKPVIASNFPLPLRIKLMRSADKQKGLDVLGDDRHLAPEKLLPNSPLYWKRADNATRGHSMFMAVETDEQSRLISTPSLWDNSMGESCVKALDSNPGSMVLHLNGGFHSQYWSGTADQVSQRKPEAKVLCVAIRAISNPSAGEVVGEPVADFVVFVPSRATNVNEGNWGVIVPRDNGFRIHIPEAASSETRVPLLIWLNEDGLSLDDAMDHWKGRIGKDAAIAVIEPTHRQQERDMSLGGRWFWPDRFPEDIGSSHHAIEQVWHYLLNRYPIDPKKVCLAGEGTGATVVSAATLLTGKMELVGIAINPRQYNKLKDFPLPLLEDWGKEIPPKRNLAVFGSEQDGNWWKGELKEYTGVGLETSWQNLSKDPWEMNRQLLTSLRQGLQLTNLDEQAGRKSEAAKEKTRKLLITNYNTSKERHWLKLLADRLSDESTDVAVATAKQAEDFPDVERIDWKTDLEKVKQGAIPLCPGSFGGTTVLVLRAPQLAELASWLKLEEKDPLSAKSRFHRLRIAVEAEGERKLDSVLQKLLKENRKNVLIVPAEFYAGEQVMAELQKMAEPFSDQMTLQWSPGLGGEVQK